MTVKRKLNILIIDDDGVQLKIVSAMVENYGQAALPANGHKAALALLESKNVDLILMDIEMPEINGFELTKIIRNQDKKWIPIIFLSANETDKYLIQGIDAGGDDYLTKPVNETILNAKIRAMIRLADMQQELDDANKKLEILSCIDPLTKVLNRRGLDDILKWSWSSNSRLQAEMSLLMLDIDYFKPYNDNYGHPAGDECLRTISEQLQKMMKRDTDTVARYGGEEFLIVLPHTHIEGAQLKANEILKTLAELNIKHEYSQVAEHITASIGITSTGNSAHNIQALIKQADVALYQAKKRGRNQSVLYKSAKS